MRADNTAVLNSDSAPDVAQVTSNRTVVLQYAILREGTSRTSAARFLE